MQRYSAPQRLHPPVSFADSPPWQGGPRGLSNPANKAKAAHESAKRHYPHKIQCSTTKHSNSCRRQRQAITWRVSSDDRRIHNESPGVQGGAPPWCFSPGFSRKAGKNQGSFALDLIEQSPGLFDPAGQATPGRAATLHLVRIGRHTGGKVSTSPPARQRSLNAQQYLCRYYWLQRRPNQPWFWSEYRRLGSRSPTRPARIAEYPTVSL